MRKKIKAEWFEVDQLGIDSLKNRCFNQAKEFSYFRKGEWLGGHESLNNAQAYQVAWPMVVMTAVAAYPGAKAIVEDASKLVGATASTVNKINRRYIARRKRKHHICRRVICSSRVGKAVIAGWEEICGEGSVVTIPKTHVGPFTYVVSDRMWAIFTRFGKNKLRGIQGRDRHVISMLRKSFDLEFNAEKMRKTK